MAVDRPSDSTDTRAEKDDKPPADNTPPRPPPDWPGSPRQPSRLESRAAAIRDQKAAAEQREKNEAEQSSPADQESGGEAGEQGSTDRDQPGSTTETEESPQESEPRDDRAPAQVRFESPGRPQDDDPPSTRTETPEGETDDVEPGEQPDPVRPEQERETVSGDDLKAPAKVPSNESAEQEDEQKPIPPEQVKDEPVDPPETGTQLETEDQPEASLVPDTGEKPEDEATTELDGRQVSDDAEGADPNFGELSQVRSAEGFPGITRAMSREASRNAQRAMWEANNPSEPSKTENMASEVALDQEQPAMDKPTAGETVAEADDPEGDDRIDAWRDHIDSMKATWADLESELPADQPLDKNDQGEGPLGEKGNRGDDEDLSGDEPGSWRGDGDQYLNLEENYSVDRAFGRMRDQETNVTDVLRTSQTEVADAKLVGLEHRLKGEDRFKEKVAEQLAAEHREDPRRAAEMVPDGLRYTYQIPTDKYAQGYRDIVEKLKDDGYELMFARNSWHTEVYKGINSRWRTSDGQLFEVQFHTPESFEAKQLTHKAYERRRSPLVGDLEAEKLDNFQREVSAGIPMPRGVADISNFRREDY